MISNEVLLHTVSAVNGARLITLEEIDKLNSLSPGGGGGAGLITYIVDNVVKAKETYKVGEPYTPPRIIVPDKFLVGWFWDKALTVVWNEGSLCTGDTTLYGKYVAAFEYRFLPCIPPERPLLEHRLGPTLHDCQREYYNHGDLPVLEGMDYRGYQNWKVPASGTYEITVVGGKGGAGALDGNLNEKAIQNGQILGGTCDLTKDDILTVLVGTDGFDAGKACPSPAPTGRQSAAGVGGGASFVMRQDSLYPIILAGGGAGSGERHSTDSFIGMTQSNRTPNTFGPPNTESAGPLQGCAWGAERSRQSNVQGFPLLSGRSLYPTVRDTNAQGGSGMVWSPNAADNGSNGGFGGGSGGNADGGASGGGYSQHALAGRDAYDSGLTGIGYFDNEVYNRLSVKQNDRRNATYVTIKRVL